MGRGSPGPPAQGQTMKGQGRQPCASEGRAQRSDRPAEGWSELREQGGLGLGRFALKVTQRATYTEEVYFLTKLEAVSPR